MDVPSGLFIDGIWREGSDGTSVPVVDPAAEEAFAEVYRGTPADAGLAVAAAQKALTGEWARWIPAQRGRLLLSAAAAGLDAGHVTINGSAAFGFEVPFGGNKLSGFGREGGPEAVLAYTRLKNVWVNLERG